MTQISFDAKQTNSSSKSFSILGAALRVPLIHNKASLRIIKTLMTSLIGQDTQSNLTLHTADKHEKYGCPLKCTFFFF